MPAPLTLAWRDERSIEKATRFVMNADAFDNALQRNGC